MFFFKLRVACLKSSRVIFEFETAGLGLLASPSVMQSTFRDAFRPVCNARSNGKGKGSPYNRPRRLRRGWVVSTTPRPLYPRERPGTHCTGGWVGPRAGLDGCGKSRPHRDSIPGMRCEISCLGYFSIDSFCSHSGLGSVYLFMFIYCFHFEEH